MAVHSHLLGAVLLDRGRGLETPTPLVGGRSHKGSLEGFDIDSVVICHRLGRDSEVQGTSGTGKVLHCTQV